MRPHPSLLHAFRHPAVIAAILALLLNDHVLKAAAPSALTGKLSDFAGLFFFPFLVGVALQALARLASRRIGPRPALLVGFVLTAAVFIPIKTLPGANALAAVLAGGILNGPAYFSLDPTDLLALTMFLPAWHVWRIIEGRLQPAVRGATHWGSGRLAYAALALGALTSLATPPCQTVASVQRLALADGTLYAGFGYDNPGGFARSADLQGGWESLPELPAAVQMALSKPASLPLTLCDPANAQTCYRIDGRPQVEESLDGGSTWSAAWQIPAGRQDYMQRAAGGRGLSCGKIPDFRTFDMLFLPALGEPGLVVAMGNEGLLVHLPSIGWQRQGIEIYYNGYLQPTSPRPTPFAAATLVEGLSNTQPELWLFLAVGCLVYTGFSLWGWVFAARHRSPDAEHTAGWIFRPLRWLGILILILMAVWLFRFSPSMTGTASTILILAGLALPPLVLVLSLVLWYRASRLVARPGRFKWAGGQALLSGIAVFAAAWAILLLWAFGVIAAYGLALALSIFGGLAVLAACVTWMRRTLQRALPDEK